MHTQQTSLDAHICLNFADQKQEPKNPAGLVRSKQRPSSSTSIEAPSMLAWDALLSPGEDWELMRNREIPCHYWLDDSNFMSVASHKNSIFTPSFSKRMVCVCTKLWKTKHRSEGSTNFSLSRKDFTKVSVLGIRKMVLVSEASKRICHPIFVVRAQNSKQHRNTYMHMYTHRLIHTYIHMCTHACTHTRTHT